MSYSKDLRTRVIDYIENGGSILSATRIYKVGRSTIYRWLARIELKPTKITRRQRKLDGQAFFNAGFFSCLIFEFNFWMSLCWRSALSTINHLCLIPMRRKP